MTQAATDPNLIPLTAAAAALAPYGVRAGYHSLWTLAVNGRLPSVRQNNRVYLVGAPADLARLVKREVDPKSGRLYTRKAAA